MRARDMAWMCTNTRTAHVLHAELRAVPPPSVTIVQGHAQLQHGINIFTLQVCIAALEWGNSSGQIASGRFRDYGHPLGGLAGHARLSGGCNAQGRVISSGDSVRHHCIWQPAS